MPCSGAVTLRGPLARRTTVIVGVMAIGAVVAVIGSLLPWLRTGGRTRNSYELFRIAERLGFAPDGPVTFAMRCWPLVPLLAISAVVAAWWGWPRAGGALGIVAATYAGGVAAAIAAAPDARYIDVMTGAVGTAIGGLVLLAGSVAAIIVGNPRAAASLLTPPTAPGR